ncbi:uncharacterized protein DUF3696 [Plasticicumulans lactativorans]|uniref:Uncharacterized protein DUF3696 n=1 Tax=Plasticicumulans lactativorans TaxID=1133106 RepID=A0A4R2LAD7_9GAMM|nr:DUF3696 domain-containing protein [Plasticicumulans lactativorans]TCO81272.1 uncharacterized protein DUF3696 [Plasticicumulans lactativorans]
MLTSLQLKNFKAWRDTGEVTLRPVTMLLGTNSSGKSSLIQSLLLLKQTVQSPDRTIHLNLGGDELNDYFNFGDFDDVLTIGCTDPRRFELAFAFRRPAGERIQDGHFHCSYGKTSSGAVAVQELELLTDGRRLRAVRREKGAYSLFVDDEAQPRGKSRDFAPERSIALSAEAIVQLGAEGALAQDLSLAIRRELENVVYLGPLRRKPERDYVWNKSNPGEIGSDGHKAIDVLLASALTKNGGQGEIVAGVSRWLTCMKIADHLEVRQVGRSTRYEVVVHKDGVQANLRDVGIGISQVLPVLTVAHFAPPGSTVILEEPEIHLHPLAQAVLAELFVEVSQKRGIQFIVETHSEHVFRRMQTLIAQQRTQPDQCALYFVERDEATARLRPLAVDDFGTVSNWPPHFFGDSVGEARAQAQARAQRMRDHPYG